LTEVFKPLIPPGYVSDHRVAAALEVTLPVNGRRVFVVAAGAGTFSLPLVVSS
jgi:hypothetical protein